MIDPFEDSLWSSALAEAFRWHAGQKRKSTGQAYVIHCVEVAAVLERLRFEQATIIAGLLHDTLEDTDMPAARIRDAFGEEVFAIVAALTERKLDESGEKRPWFDRKIEHIRQLREAPVAVRAVALADQRQNLMSVLMDWEPGDAAFWDAFNASAVDYRNYHRARMNACLGTDTRLEALACDVVEKLDRLSQRIDRELKGIVPKFDDSDWA